MTIQIGTLITGIVLAVTSAAYSSIVLCLTKKSNLYARIGIVCSQIATQVQKRYQFRNLDKLKDNGVRKQIVSFVQRYGTTSAQLIELAKFVRDLAKNLMPKLAALRND